MRSHSRKATKVRFVRRGPRRARARTWGRNRRAAGEYSSDALELRVMLGHAGVNGPTVLWMHHRGRKSGAGARRGFLRSACREISASDRATFGSGRPSLFTAHERRYADEEVRAAYIGEGYLKSLLFGAPHGNSCCFHKRRARGFCARHAADQTRPALPLRRSVVDRK